MTDGTTSRLHGQFFPAHVEVHHYRRRICHQRFLTDQNSVRWNIPARPHGPLWASLLLTHRATLSCLGFSHFLCTILSKLVSVSSENASPARLNLSLWEKAGTSRNSGREKGEGNRK